MGSIVFGWRLNAENACDCLMQEIANFRREDFQSPHFKAVKYEFVNSGGWVTVPARRHGV